MDPAHEDMYHDDDDDDDEDEKEEKEEKKLKQTKKCLTQMMRISSFLFLKTLRRMESNKFFICGWKDNTRTKRQMRYSSSSSLLFFLFL